MTFVDTNYFLRFLLEDNNDQFKKVEKLVLDGSAGKVQLLSSTIVFFEIYWVLFSYYKNKKTAILSTLNKILDLVFIDFEERDRLQYALNIYSDNNLDLEDSYNLAVSLSKNADDFKSFDKKVVKIWNEKKLNPSHPPDFPVVL